MPETISRLALFQKLKDQHAVLNVMTAAQIAEPGQVRQASVQSRWPAIARARGVIDVLEAELALTNAGEDRPTWDEFSRWLQADVLVETPCATAKHADALAPGTSQPAEVYTEIARRHGLLARGQPMPAAMVDAFADLVELCAAVGDGYGDAQAGGCAGDHIRALYGPHMPPRDLV